MHPSVSVMLIALGVNVEPSAAVLERQWWADAPMNERLESRSDGSFTAQFPSKGTRRAATRRIEMRKQIIIRCYVKVDVAACLRVVAAIIYFLM